MPHSVTGIKSHCMSGLTKVLQYNELYASTLNSF